MLLPDELKKYGFQRNLKLREQIWLDYLQDHVLALVYRKNPELVFRGGTCIWKVYKGKRFSEDLDLASKKIPNDLDRYLLKELEFLGFTVTPDKKRETKSMYRLRLEFDLPNTGSTTLLSLEILKDSVPDGKIKEKELHSPYPDVPVTNVKSLSLDALLLDKILAVYDRDRPRDMYDLSRLLKRGALASLKEVKEQCKDFTVEGFEQTLEDKRGEWKTLENLLMGDLPKFEKEKEYIMRKLRKMN